MSVSPVRAGWFRSFSGFFVLLALAGGSPLCAWAQSQGYQAEPDQDVTQPAVGAPLRLAPPTALVPDQSGGLPATLVPTSRTLPANLPRNLDEPTTGASTGSSTGPSGIEINPLGEVDPEAIGILDARNGGFRDDMWSRSDRAAVVRLLPRIPVRTNSATLRTLARRLLLTNATPPQSRGRSAEGGASLLSARVDRLAALGDIGGLNELLRLVPQRHEDDRIARARTEGLLLSGQSEAACREIRREALREGVSGYWRRAMIYCQLQSGEVDQAMLGVGLMAEQGTTADDPAFFSLVDAFTGAEVPEVTVDSPLHLAMLNMTDRPLPEGLIEEASPGLLVAIAGSEKTELEPRTLAAERAVSIGVLDPRSLVAIYDLYVFDSSELDNPRAALAELTGPPGRALLYQAVRDRDQWAERADLLQRALVEAENPALYQLLVQVFLPDLLEVPVTPQLLWFAEPGGRALYAAGRYGDAAAWYTLARQEAVIDPQGASAVTALWPYARLAGNPTLLWQGDLEAWRASREDETPEELARQAWLRGAFKALGEEESVSWIDLATGESDAPRPDGALLFALRDASDMGRVGETVLLSILIIGEAGPAECHPTAFIAALTALREVGLEPEARALAIEAAVAKGI